MNFDLNYKSLATVIVWVVIVAAACTYFYKQELHVGQMAPKILAAQSMSAEELSYVYEADLSEMYIDQNEQVGGHMDSIWIYMYEDKKLSSWGRVIIYDKTDKTFQYIIRSSNGSKLYGLANLASGNSYISDDNNSHKGCKIALSMVSKDKLNYKLQNIDNTEGLKCESYGNNNDSNLNKLWPGLIHKKI